MESLFLRFCNRLTVKYVTFALLASLVPLLFLHYYAVQSSSEMLLTSLTENLREKSFLVAADIDRLIEQRLTDVRVLSQADVLEGPNLPAITKYLDEIIAETAYLDDIDILDLEGRIIACSNEQSEVGRYVNELYPGVATILKKATQARQSDVFVSEALRLNSGSGLVFLTPITDESNSKVIRVLMLEFNLGIITDIVTAFDDRVIGNEHVYLVDNSGRVLVTQDMTVDYLESFPDLKVTPQLLDAFAVQGQVGTVVYTDSDGHEVVAGYANMAEFGRNKALDWSIIAKVPVNEIIVPALILKKRLLIFTFTVSGLLCILIFYGSRSLVRPITKIAAIANEIAKGNLAVDVPIRRDDELGLLAGSISHMIGALKDGATKNKELTAQLQEKINDLSESETRQHTIIQTIGDALITMDENGLIESLNPAAEKTFGYPAAELPGRDIALLLSEDARQAHKAHHAASEQPPLPIILNQSVETQGRRKDGSLFPMEVSIASMKLGSRRGFVAIMRDITERREAEYALSEASELSNRIIAESPIGVAIYDQTGQCIAANDAVAEMIGATREQVLAQNYNEIESWKKFGLLEVAKSCIANQEKQRHEFVVTTTFGKQAFFDCLFVPLTIREERRLLFMIDDISERKQSEEVLRESEEKFLLLLNSTGEGIYGLDLEGNCTFCNSACLSLLGYEDENQALGQNMHNLTHHTRPDGSFYPENQCKMYLAFREEMGTHIDNEVLWRADGTSFAAEYRSHPIFQKGEIVGSVVSFADISERKEAEDQLKQALAEKEVLLKEIHHRVKNNMQIISSLMYLQAQKIDDPETVKILQESQGRVRSMGLIHEQLYQTENLAKISFKKYMETLINSIRQSSGSIATGVTFQVEAADIELPVDTAIPCGLIVNELITNSLKHAFDAEQPGVIKVRLVKEADIYTLAVRDNGKGVSNDYDWSSPKTLGLTLIRTLAGQLDADLKFENDNGLECRIAFKVDEAA